MDGVTITTDLLSALRSGLVNASLLIQTMQCEMDTYEPNATIYDMSAAQYDAFLQSFFSEHGWPASAASVVSSLYAAEIAQSRELGYQKFLADYSFFCGNVAVAVAAAQGGNPRVYTSLVSRGPDNALPVFPDQPPATFAGHMWDYIAGYAPALGCYACMTSSMTGCRRGKSFPTATPCRHTNPAPPILRLATPYSGSG